MAVLRGGMGTRDEPRPSSALPLPVPLPPATLCDAAFPPYPTPFAREGRNFLRDPSGKAHLLRNASSCRVGARICVCIFRGGRHCWGPPPPRSRARLLPGCAARPRGGTGLLPPSLPLFLPPSSPSRRAETAGAARMGGRSELRARLPAAGRRSGRSRR